MQLSYEAATALLGNRPREKKTVFTHKLLHECSRRLSMRGKYTVASPHTDNCSVTKRNELLTHTTQVNLEGILLSEKDQAQKVTDFIIPLV